MALPDHDHECFFISPIGKDGSHIRHRADGVRDFIVKPAVAALDRDLVLVRADDIARPGQITLDVIDHVLKAKVAVADLTGLNPNVFYELAARHAAKLPVVLIAHEAQIESLPFDIQQMRTVAYDDKDLKKAADAREAITEHLAAGLAGAVDSPLAAALNLDALRRGSTGDQLLADLLGRVDDLSRGQQKILRTLQNTRAARTVSDSIAKAAAELANEIVEPSPPKELSADEVKLIGSYVLDSDSGPIDLVIDLDASGEWVVVAGHGEEEIRFFPAVRDFSAIAKEARHTLGLSIPGPDDS